MPSVYQSAGKLIIGHITKHGSPHVRRMLIEVAHAISRTKADSKLKRFYFRIKGRHGAKVAVVVALARKVLCILHHLIVNPEMFEDETSSKSKREKPSRSSSSTELIIEDAIQILVRAGYMVQKRSEKKGG